jgi:transcriptional regulator with XRE-family HTH domain
MPENAQNLKEWRRLKKLRQEDLADLLEEPRGTYQAWESGRAAFPPEVIAKIKKMGFKGVFPEPGRGITLSDLESIREEIRTQVAWVREELRKENAALAADLQEALKTLAALQGTPSAKPR